VSLIEKIDEFSELGRFKNVVAISSDEQREMSGACAGSTVHWRLPPFMEEVASHGSLDRSEANDLTELDAIGGIPDEVAEPSLQMIRAYYARPDLQSIFRLDNSEGRRAFFRWWFFFGRREVAGSFGLTKRQFDWIVGNLPGGKVADFDGMLRLILSVREDLRRAFRKGDETNVEALVAWGKKHAEREYGFSKSQLLQDGERELNAKKISDQGGSTRVLRAILDANPPALGRSAKDAEGLLERVAKIEKIDLVLIGSGHPSNVQSFRWFLSEVFLPHLASKGRNLFIVGSACGKLDEFSHRNLVMLGRCVRISPMILAAQACPLPVVYGSGSPIKTIPAMALNGAVTATPHVDRAFGLSDYGIPSFADPREFADDVNALLVDSGRRSERQAKAARFVSERLTFEGYVEFWRSLLAA
jgi:hypothetical protein